MNVQHPVQPGAFEPCGSSRYCHSFWCGSDLQRLFRETRRPADAGQPQSQPRRAGRDPGGCGGVEGGAMSLARYASHCAMIGSQFVGALGAHDPEELKQDLDAVGRAAWMKWVFENLEWVSKFPALTPPRSPSAGSGKTRSCAAASAARLTGGAGCRRRSSTRPASYTKAAGTGKPALPPGGLRWNVHRRSNGNGPVIGIPRFRAPEAGLQPRFSGQETVKKR